MLDSGGSAHNYTINVCNEKVGNLILESKFEIEETPSHSRTSTVSEADESEDGMDCLMFCTPSSLAFNQCTYELTVKYLLGII
mgnify:CR=1 FL=1